MNRKLQVFMLGVLFCFIAVAPSLNAQTAQDKTWMSVFIGHQEYDGDYINEMLQFGIEHDVTGGIGIQQYLNPSFDLDLSLTLGRIDDEYRPNYFSMYMVNTNLMAHYKLTNGYLFKEYATIKPFFAAGLGFSSFMRGTEPDNTAFQVPLGAGFNIALSDNVEVTYKGIYNRTFSDDIDGNTSWDSKNHDDILIHTLGLKFNLGASEDTDRDGVADKYDECPDVMGDPKTNGCPDRDGDRIIDSEDRCPNQPGIAEFSGCPDTDVDGVPDYEDRCPTVAGTAAMHGCPDSDSDGVADYLDKCPMVAGSKEANGCPDSDNDGIVDYKDNCPNRAGVAENNGCPKVTKNVSNRVELIFNHLMFATDKAVIHESSNKHLNDLVNIMEEDEDLLLHLAGHADSRDTQEYNQQLSEERANAVKQYLINKGIDGSRITTIGYGETQPIAENTTTDGQNRNRRVVLTLSYQ